MSLFETLPSERTGNGDGVRLDDVGGTEKGEALTAREESIQVPDSLPVSVEVPVSDDGFRADAPIQYGEGHVGLGAVEQGEGIGIAGDGPGALHLSLPPLDVSASHPKSPEGSLDGPTPDLYITGHGKQGGETPEQLRARRRREGLRSYSGNGSELQLPLSSERQSIHPTRKDGV